MGISSGGLVSGIDTSTMIDQLVEVETTSKVTPVENKRDADTVKISAYSQVQTLVSDLCTKIEAISETSDFSVYTSTSSDEDYATLSGGTGSTPGNYTLTISHLATSERLISANGLVTSQTAALSSFGIQTGTISIDGTELSIDENDTIQDLRSKINSATDENGEELNVTASVIQISDNNFRLVLTSKDTGDAGVEYKDVTGSTLTDLGIIMSTDGDKGISYQTLSSTQSVKSAFEALSVDSAISISGLDHDGNSVSRQIIVSKKMDADGFLEEVKSAFNDTVDVSFSDDGLLQISDKIGGESKLSVSFDTFGDTAVGAMQCTGIGTKGSNVLLCGSNAYFQIDGINLESENNKSENVIPGATVYLKKATSGEYISLSLDRDTDGISSKIKAVVDSFNSLKDYISTATDFATDDDSENGDLAGDMTASGIMDTISSTLRAQFSSASGIYKSLAALGITTDYQTGHLSIDSDKLTKALEDHYNDVVCLFTTNGSSLNSAVSLGMKGTGTQSGTYEVARSEDGSSYQIRKVGLSTWYSATSVSGDIIKFDDGPAKGLYLTIDTNFLAAGQSTTFTYSKGLGDTVKDMLDGLTDSTDGRISLRQKALQKDKEDLVDRIETLNERIEKYRAQLVKQYSAMEQALSQLQSQSSSISAFSSSSSS